MGKGIPRLHWRDGKKERWRGYNATRQSSPQSKNVSRAAEGHATMTSTMQWVKYSEDSSPAPSGNFLESFQIREAKLIEL